MQNYYDSVSITGNSSTSEILSIIGNGGTGTGRFQTNQAEIWNLVPHSGSSFPTSPTPIAGQLFYYTGVGADGTGLYQYISSAWQKLINKAAIDSALSSYMLKATYDTDGNGVVDNSSKLNNQDASYYLNPANLSAVVPVAKGGTGLNATGTANQLLSTGTTAGTLEYRTLNGTSNRITVSPAANSITLSTPQDIHTGASPTFNAITISSASTSWSSTSAATKGYVDERAVGLKVKTAVRVATTANITRFGLQTIDGVSLLAGNRVLVKNQTTEAHNGIYVVVDQGNWTRTSDCGTWTDLYQSYVWVEEGNTHAQQGWLCAIPSTGTLDTTAITYAKFSEAGMISAGDGLNKAGETISAKYDSTSTESVSGSIGVKVDPTGGIMKDTNGIKAKLQAGLYSDASGIGISSGYSPKFYTADIPSTTQAANTDITITHNLGSVPYSVQFLNSAGAVVYPQIVSNTTTALTVRFSVQLAGGAMKCYLVAMR